MVREPDPSVIPVGQSGWQMIRAAMDEVLAARPPAATHG